MTRMLFLVCLNIVVLSQLSLHAGERQKVRIGVCLSLTGDFAEYGRIYLAGVELGIDEYNRQKDRKYNLEVVYRDDKSDAATAASIVQELADKENVVAVIGSVSSGVTMAMREESMKRGLVLITPSATSTVFGRDGDGVVRVLFDDEFQGEALAKYTAERLGCKRAGILMNKRFDYSRSIGNAFRTHLGQRGGTVHQETYDVSLIEAEEFNFRPLLERIKAHNPQIILIPSYPEDVSAILRQAQDVGMTNAKFCGGDAWHHETTLLASGNAIEGAFYISVMNEDEPNERSRKFVSLLDNSNYDADIISAQSYDAVLILIEALKNGPSREAVHEGVYTIRDLPLVTGSITIDREKGSLKPAFIVEVRKDGNDFESHVIGAVKP